MTNKQRTDLIERHLREHKYADLHSLAQRFGGSLSTVRRILDGLEERGVVRRHHGGASVVEGDALARENDFLTRIQRQADRKFRIASVIAEQVAPGEHVGDRLGLDRGRGRELHAAQDLQDLRRNAQIVKR